MPTTQPPERIEPESLSDYLDVMSKAVFQAGFSWPVVASKWPGTREAFRGFDPEAVAAMVEPDIDALAQNTRVFRNRRKLEAIVGNAAKMLDLESEHGTFGAYLRSHADFDATVKSLRKEFKFLGDVGCYFFLHVIGEEVPPHDVFEASRARK
jgi:3-methyladenine DNA glycosylase Tag